MSNMDYHLDDEQIQPSSKIGCITPKSKIINITHNCNISSYFERR